MTLSEKTGGKEKMNNRCFGQQFTAWLYYAILNAPCYIHLTQNGGNISVILMRHGENGKIVYQLVRLEPIDECSYIKSACCKVASEPAS